MTWEDWAVARQVVAEEFIGGPIRSVARAEQEAEQAEIDATKDALRKQGPPVVLQPRVVDADPQTEQARLRTIQPRPITDEIVGA